MKPDTSTPLADLSRALCFAWPQELDIEKLQNENAALKAVLQNAREKRDRLVAAKKRHREKDCEYALGGHTCGACHFYSGAIEALNEVLGEHVTPESNGTYDAEEDDNDYHCPSRNQGPGD